MEHLVKETDWSVRPPLTQRLHNGTLVDRDKLDNNNNNNNNREFSERFGRLKALYNFKKEI